MRICLLLVLLAAAAAGQPVGWLAVEVDSLPAKVYLDGELRSLASPTTFELSPGRHFVSLFEPRQVYRAYNDGAPEAFWERLFAQGLVTDADRDRLVSSYERGAVRVGTKWVYVVPDETLDVRLSAAEVSATYHRDSSGMLTTFVGWTLLIGLGMVLSVFLVKLG